MDTVIGCATHPENRRPRFHYTTRTAGMRHASTDASRIQRFELQIINWTEDSFTPSLSSFFQFAPHCQNSSRGLIVPIFHPFPLLERESSCSESTITHISRGFEGRRSENPSFRLKSVFYGFFYSFSLLFL